MFKKAHSFLLLAAVSLFIFSCVSTGIGKNEPDVTIVDTSLESKLGKLPKDKSIQKKTYYLETDIHYPEFEGKPLLNKIIENSILSYYKEFEKASEKDWNTYKEESEIEQPFYYGTSYNFICGKKYTSVIVITEIYSGGAHGTQILNSYNYDEKQQQLKVNVQELTGYTYTELSELCRQKLYSKLSKTGTADKEWIDNGTEPFPDNFEIFTMADSSVTIYFEPYAVAPYSEGIQSVKLNLK